MKSTAPSPNVSRLFPQFIPTFFLLLCLASPLCASDRYLEPGHPDGVALLAPPPAPGSEEETADLEMSRAVVKARTSAETARAIVDMKLNVFNFAEVIGPIFQPGQLPKTEAFLAKVGSELH